MYSSKGVEIDWRKCFKKFMSLFPDITTNGEVSKYQMIKACSNGDLETAVMFSSQSSLYSSELELAAKHGHLDIIVALSDGLDENVCKKCMAAAVSTAQIECAEFLFSKGLPDDDQTKYTIMYNGISSGDVEMVEWLVSKGFTFGNLSVTHAVATGNMDLVHYVLKHSHFTIQLVDVYEAAKNSHHHILEWMYGQPMYKPIVTVMSVGLYICTDETLEWWWKNMDLDSQPVNWLWLGQLQHNAIENGCVSVIEWLHKKFGMKCTHQMFMRTVSLDHLDLAKFIHYEMKVGDLYGAYSYGVIHKTSTETFKWICNSLKLHIRPGQYES